MSEAAKLLEGRSVLKLDSGLLSSQQGKWLQLDAGLSTGGKHVLKEFSARDFALDKQLASLSIRLKRPEIADEKILRAMESGAQVSVKAVTGEEVYLEANPAARSIIFRDSAGKECTEKQVMEMDKRRQQQLQVEKIVKVERNNTKNNSRHRACQLVNLKIYKR